MEAALTRRLRRGLALLAASWAAHAAAAQDAGLAACAEIADAAERLACYDRVAAPPSAQEPAVAEPATQSSANAAAEAAATQPSPASRATEPPAERAAPERNAAGVAVEQLAEPRQEAAAIEAEAAEESRTRGFLRRLLRRDRSPDEPDKEAEEEPVAAGEIVRIAKLPLGNYQLTLDDGQVWRENERETHTSYAVGDRIEVFKGAFGTFNLTNERTGQSIKARRVR